METKYKTFLIIKVTLLFFVLATLFSNRLLAAEAENSDPNQSSKYLDAVREFADNVLKYGRDTYGPKHTPLFVDGLNVHTHEPVKWIDPNGTKWILSNLASQQTLMRTLDGLSTITGDAKYRESAIQAIKYALEHLRTPNGLLYWGHQSAYDALLNKVHGDRWHTLKLHYPYYELMWQVDANATERFIEVYWSAHVNDWSNLDFGRGARFGQHLEEPWNHEYKNRPKFFKSKSEAGAFPTGSSLVHAGTTLYRLSGQERPLVWSKRLVKRFIDTRHPNTGISARLYNHPNPKPPLGEDMKEHFVDPHTTLFPYVPFEYKYMYYPENTEAYPWMSMFLVGEMLSEEGKEFTRWALEELTAWGKVSYRKRDNSFVPILTDGTNLEGYVLKEGISQLNVAKPCLADASFFWAYGLAYRVTSNEFMWEMVRDIGLGNSFGDIGESPRQKPKLNVHTNCSNVYGLLGFLELHAKTKKPEYLEMAQRIGDNILLNQFYKGFFVPSKRHIYTRFDCFEALALLHLDAAMKSKIGYVPRVWPSVPLFVPPYRHKEKGIDRQIIYTLTESSEPPLSLQEAAAIGDVNKVRSLLDKGVSVDSWDDPVKKTALHRAAVSGHKEVVELLLDKGAQIDAKDAYGGTALHYASERGHKEVTELLITKGADVNATTGAGDTPLHHAARGGHKNIVELLIAKGADISAKNNVGQTPVDIASSRNRKEIVQLLLAKGATISSIHVAAQVGDLTSVKAFLEEGIDINIADERGFTPLHYAVRGGHKEVTEFLIDKAADINARGRVGKTPLYNAVWNKDKDMVEVLIANGADVNVKNKWGQTPLYEALWNGDKDMVKLLVDQGADVNVLPNNGGTPLEYAVWYEDVEMAKLFVARGAKIELKDNDGWTAFRYAASMANRELVEFFVSKGVDVSGIHGAALMGDLVRVKHFVQQGIHVDTKDEMGWTPLYYAACTGRRDVVEFLIAKDADIKAEAEDKTTPLHQAARAGDMKIVELFISKGADVNAKAKNGNTPLHSAALGGNSAVVELLVVKGAIINVKGMHDRTPLHNAARAGHKDVVELLLEKGADVNAKGNWGRNPLWYAQNRGHTEIVELLRKHGAKEYDRELDKSLLQAAADGDVDEVKSLISKGADLSAKDWRGTALHIAAQANHKPMVESLIAAGANVNATDNAGDTPLHYVAVYGHEDIAEMLIDKGADVNIKDSLGYTPLHSASSGGHRDVAEFLIAKGSDANAKQTDGQNPLHEAAKWGHPEVVELLTSKGVDVFTQDKNGRTPLWYAKAGGNEVIVKLLPKQRSGHNVAIENISASSSCTQGDRVSIVVDVVNRSDYSETLAVTLIDVTDAITIGTKSIHLSPVGVDGMDEICDMIFPSPTIDPDYFGHTKDCGGDVNGDGYNDLVIIAPFWNSGKGRAYLYYGGPNMDTNPDKIFEGENLGDHFGLGVCLGDLNGDKYDDVILGACRYNHLQGRVYVFYGGPDMDLTYDLIIDGEEGKIGHFGWMIDVEDLDNDNHNDLLITAPGKNSLKGRAYLFYGGDPIDMNCFKVFEGENDNDLFGKNGLIGGDVDCDGYKDILIGARSFPGRNPAQGRAYLYYGNDKANMDTACDVLFNCPESGTNQFGSSTGIFDIDKDGHADVLIGARRADSGRGRVYLYWGDERAKMDALPDKVFYGEERQSAFGGDTLRCGYFNNDKYGDIAVAAYNWHLDNHTSRVYVYYGGTKTLIDTNPDKILTGVLRSRFGLYFNVGDLNNDNYDDIFAGGYMYNNYQGRAWLYYGSPGDSTKLKFDWDTTNASVGTHILKAETSPITGEEDTADNTKTIRIDVKAPSQ